MTLGGRRKISSLGNGWLRDRSVPTGSVLEGTFSSKSAFGIFLFEKHLRQTKKKGGEKYFARLMLAFKVVQTTSKAGNILF